jgi:hypothetical protein
MDGATGKFRKFDADVVEKAHHPRAYKADIGFAEIEEGAEKAPEISGR